MGGMVIPTFQRRVGEQDPPNVRVQNTATPEQYGSAIGKGLQQIGNVMQVQQEQDDRNAVIGAKANSDMQLSDYLYNTNTGVMNRKGKDALGLSDQFNEDYDNLIQKNSEGLNERQKSIYNQYALSQKDNYLKSIASHETQQRQVYTETNAKTAIANAQNLAILNPNDQNLYNSAIDTITKTRKSVFGNMGDDVVSKMVADDISGIRSEQATSMLSQGNGIAARDFLIAHKNEIDPKQYDNLYAGAESKAMVQESKAVADDVLNRYSVDNEREGFKYLEEAYGDNPGFEKFRSKVEDRYRDERRFKSQAKQHNEEATMMKIWKSGSLSESKEIINDAVNQGLIKPSQGMTLLSQVDTKFKKLEKSTDPSAARWRSYEQNGLINDVENMKLYEKIISGEVDESTVTPEKQKSFNISATKLGLYRAYLNGTNNANKRVLSLGQYRALKDKGFTDEEISTKYLTNGVE